MARELPAFLTFASGIVILAFGMSLFTGHFAPSVGGYSDATGAVAIVRGIVVGILGLLYRSGPGSHGRLGTAIVVSGRSLWVGSGFLAGVILVILGGPLPIVLPRRLEDIV